MSKVSKKLSNEVNVKYLDLFKMILLIGTLFIMFYVPYLRGLYFEPEQLITQIILLSIFILYSVYKLIKKENTLIKTPIEYAALGLVIVYLVTSFTAVSQRLAVSEFLKYVMYFIAFIMISDFVKSEKEKKFLLWTIVSSALGVCIIGIDSVTGGKIVEVLNSIFKALNLNINFFGLFVGGRIHSTMQYPNALASYLMAVFFVAQSLIITSRKWAKSIASAASFVLLTTFVFTISRGAYILLVFAVALFLITLPKGSKLRGFYSLITVGITSVAFSIALAGFITNSQANKVFIWPLVLLGILVSFFIRYTDDFAISLLSKVNLKIVSISTAVICITLIIVLYYIVNASVPLELSHKMNEQSGYIGKSKTLQLISGKKYRLDYNVDAKSENKDASYAYRIYIKSRDESGINSENEFVIVEKRESITDGVEKREIEFTVPENSELVTIAFQNYYTGTNVKFINVSVIDANSGKEVKQLVLKRKFSFVESVLSRFENITADKSFNTRLVFFKDGFKIFKDWWLIGAGGGAWSILNFNYQSYLYWSTQTHSYPLQVVVETGLLGLMFLVLLLISIVISFIRLLKKINNEDINEKIYTSAVFTSIVFLFFHSFIDFDFSLASIYLLVWQLIAFLNINVRQYLLVDSKGEGKNRKVKSDIKNLIEVLKIRLKKGIFAHPVAMIIIATVVLIYPIIFLTAYNYSNTAFELYKKNDFDGAIKLIEKSAELDYLNTKYITGYAPISTRQDIKLGFIDILIKKIEISSKQADENKTSKDKAVLNSYIHKAQELAKKAEKHAKYNSDLLLNLGVYYLNTNEKQKGIDFVNKSVELKRLVPAQWQYKAYVNYIMASSYFQNGDNEKGLEFIGKVLNIIDEAKKVNISNLSPFIFNDTTQTYLEKAFYIKSGIAGKEIKTENLVFQSIFNMDVDSNGIPDQWTVSDKSIVDAKIHNGAFNIGKNDMTKKPYIYTRNLGLEQNNQYKIEVELIDPDNIKSIPYRIPGLSERIEQLNFNDGVYSAEVLVSNKSDKNMLHLYIENNYEIKSVRITQIN